MAFSIKNTFKKAVSSVGSAIAGIRSAVTRAPSQSAAAVMASPNRSIMKSGPIGTTSQQANSTSVATKKPVYVSPSGQQYVPSPSANSLQRTTLGSRVVSSGGSNRSPSGLGSPNIPTTISSSSLASGASVSGLPSAGPTGVYGGGMSSPTGQGALASIKAGMTSPAAYDTKDSQQSDTTAVRDQNQFDAQGIIDMISGVDREAPSIDRAKIMREERRAAQIEQKQQEVSNYQTQLNAIQAQAQADQLSLVGQGRGIPEVIIGGQQEKVAREAAIRALPVAAQLAAAQNNLQLAQDHLDTMYKLRVQEAEDRYNRWQQTRDAVLPLLTEREKRRVALLDRDKANQREDEKLAAERDWDMYKLRVSASLKSSGESSGLSFGGGNARYGSDLDATIGTVLSTIDSKFGQQQFINQIARARNDPDKLNIVAAQVLKGQPAEFKNDFRNQAIGISQLDKAIALIDSGVQTGVFNAASQYVYNIAGEDFDPRLARINSYITSAIQPYRNSVTGAAWGDQEDTEYQQLFGSTRYSPAALRQRLVQMKELLKSKSSEGLNSVANPLGYGSNLFQVGAFAVGEQPPDDATLREEYKALSSGQATGSINYLKPVSDFFSSLTNSLFR